MSKYLIVMFFLLLTIGYKTIGKHLKPSLTKDFAECLGLPTYSDSNILLRQSREKIFNILFLIIRWLIKQVCLRERFAKSVCQTSLENGPPRKLIGGSIYFVKKN